MDAISTLAPPPAKAAVDPHSMIATGNPLAAEAARLMLQAGGSAIDAAIAADAVMGVVEPMATGIGGDLLAMIVLPDGNVRCYNGTGRAPLALSLNHLRDLPGQRIPERHPLSLTTPGAVRGWQDLHERYGRLEWPRLFQPAIDIALEGFAVAPVAAREWRLFRHVIRRDPACAELYRAGSPPAVGERFANPALGRSLQRIAEEGAAAFYSGALAERTVAAAQAAGGILGVIDLARHRGTDCEPVSSEFRGARLYQCPPNTHGVAVLHALDSITWQDMGRDDPRSMVRMVDATAQAMAHASRTVCDPAGNTVCTVVVDSDGMAVTLMSSIFKRFGSGIAVPEGGFVLQNRGFGFSTPGHINAPGPAKRPYHTVVPGAATRDGRFLLGMGVVGGLMQPQGQVQILARLLAWEESLPQALEAPRWRLEAGNTLAIEAGMPAACEDALRSAGYRPPAATAGELAGRSDFGGAHAVMRLPDGRLQGAADPRKDGTALAA